MKRRPGRRRSSLRAQDTGPKVRRSFTLSSNNPGPSGFLGGDKQLVGVLRSNVKIWSVARKREPDTTSAARLQGASDISLRVVTELRRHEPKPEAQSCGIGARLQACQCRTSGIRFPRIQIEPPVNRRPWCIDGRGAHLHLEKSNWPVSGPVHGNVHFHDEIHGHIMVGSAAIESALASCPMSDPDGCRL